MMISWCIIKQWIDTPRIYDATSCYVTYRSTKQEYDMDKGNININN